MASQYCQICKQHAAYTSVTKNSISSSLLQDMKICRIQEMLMPGKKSVTYICYDCAAHIIRCGLGMRGKRIRELSWFTPGPCAYKCQICKTGNQTSYFFVSNLDRVKKLAIFKLTTEYLDDVKTGVYFCYNCYVLMNDMNALLARFYNPNLSV